MIIDTLYALCNLAYFYCLWNAGRCARALVGEGRYLLPVLALCFVIWLAYYA